MTEPVDYLALAKKHYEVGAAGIKAGVIEGENQDNFAAAQACAFIALSERVVADMGTRDYIAKIGPMLESLAQSSAKALGGAIPIGLGLTEVVCSCPPDAQPGTTWECAVHGKGVA